MSGCTDKSTLHTTIIILITLSLRCAVLSSNVKQVHSADSFALISIRAGSERLLRSNRLCDYTSSAYSHLHAIAARGFLPSDQPVNQCPGSLRIRRGFVIHGIPFDLSATIPLRDTGEQAGPNPQPSTYLKHQLSVSEQTLGSTLCLYDGEHRLLSSRAPQSNLYFS